MKIRRRLLLVIMVFAVLAIPTLVVFAKEMGSLTITGPGIKGEMTVSDPNFSLEKSGFFDQAVLSNPPKNLNLDAGYSITAHLNLDGKTVPFAQMVYYATEAGQPGYLHYTARMNGDALQTVDEWHILSRSADDAFRRLMTGNNVAIQSALVAASVKAEAPAPAVKSVESAPITSPAPAQTPYIILVSALAIMLLVGAGLALRRRTLHTTS